MAGYLAMRIEGGHLDYSIVCRKKYRQFKETVDDILILDGYQDLIQPNSNLYERRIIYESYC